MQTKVRAEEPSENVLKVKSRRKNSELLLRAGNHRNNKKPMSDKFRMKLKMKTSLACESLPARKGSLDKIQCHQRKPRHFDWRELTSRVSWCLPWFINLPREWLRVGDQPLPVLANEEGLSLKTSFSNLLLLNQTKVNTKDVCRGLSPQKETIAWQTHALVLFHLNFDLSFLWLRELFSLSPKLKGCWTFNGLNSIPNLMRAVKKSVLR